MDNSVPCCEDIRNSEDKLHAFLISTLDLGSVNSFIPQLLYAHRKKNNTQCSQNWVGLDAEKIKCVPAKNSIAVSQPTHY
jgi:hypothetical protein